MCSTIAKANMVPTKTDPTTCDGVTKGWLAKFTSNHKQTLADTTANGKKAFMRRRLKKLSRYAKCTGKNSSLKLRTPKYRFNLALVRMIHNTK